MPNLKCLLGIALFVGGLNALPVLGGAMASAPAFSISKLEFVTEEFPPLNFNNKKSGQADGYGSELLREILRRNALNAPLTVLPWARAYKLAQTQANVGLYCAVRTDEREKLFQWVGPIGNITSVLYALPNSDLHPNSLADAKAARSVIALREGYSAQMLRRLGFNNLVLATNSTEAVRLLTTGGDKTLLLISALTVPETLAKLGLPNNAIKPLLIVMKKQLYIAFSPDTAPAVVKRFQDTLDDMRRDGSFADIHHKWFPGEKLPGLEREPDVLPE
jgi:polar amino acid transport system substrate-binding protein